MSDTSRIPTGSPPAPRQRRNVPISIATVIAAAALVCGYLLGRPAVPLDTSADAGFLRDMSIHHSQAVDMSLILIEKSPGGTLQVVAQDIARTQQEQIGRMQGWLVQWDLPARGPEPAMTWMSGHGGHGSSGDAPPESMPGMASEQRMEELRAAEGKQAEIIYLEAMIEHHIGGIDMAEAADSLAGEPMVAEFASGMVGTQQSEIDMMSGMLEERGVDRADR